MSLVTNTLHLLDARLELIEIELPRIVKRRCVRGLITHLGDKLDSRSIHTDNIADAL